MTLAVAATACAPVSSTPWRFAETATGRYVAEFPAEPTIVSLPATSTLLLTLITTAQSGDATFTITETDLRDLADYRSLDDMVDAAIADIRSQLEEASGHGQKVTHLTTTTAQFEGAESRRVACRLVGEIVTSVTLVLFYRRDSLVQAIVTTVGVDADASTDRFLGSLRSNTGSDRV
ncbi:hypothetical protein BST22_19255 [Mycolicibacterium chubuense]|uniref:Lipoprotein LpqN n=1 Tax=Mycolicibacterium chubuense TaxID=1800 RepID=A0A0J6WCS6_MYCCU|nr:hypothetical protein [Mycolicibacterium chubuense]KMO81030.1 hypothetical protein MCHUDSM44219_02084 [Mycolicibacterium chubuense]ORA47887.1 hypothetical protein BST22_19255 [Mycolicibacterium chubuense]SPY00930.1 Uncharacterised protein [Mycolicibacterium chubuense]